jgi:hypothetical protein
MRRRILIVCGAGFLAFVLVCGILLNLPEEKITFNFSNRMGSWQTSAGTGIQIEDGSVQVRKGPRDFFVVIPQINLNADLYDVCILEMKLPIAFDQGSLFFLSPYSTRKERVSLDFDTGKADHFNRLWINVSKHDDWKGIVRDIVLIPATNSENVSLKSIQFVRGNLASKLRAWWSDFTRYFDPGLGASFGWSSPYFIKGSFNSLLLPFFWTLLALVLLILAGVSIFRLDKRISKLVVGTSFFVLLVAWGLLDLQNNIYCLKAMKRNASLYWGKSMLEKKGIATGSAEFIRFMKFCDEYIPMDGFIFNYGYRDNLGSSEDALAATQFNFNLRPRVESLKLIAAGQIPKPYYVFYRTQQKEIKGTDAEQNIVNRHFVLRAREKLMQEIVLLRYFEDVSHLIFQINGEMTDPKDISVAVFADDKKSLIGSGEFLGLKNGEAFVRIVPLSDYRKSTIYLEIENRGEKTFSVGGSDSDTYRDGKCYFRGEEINGDLAFRINYEVKNLMLFNKYNEYSYILTK